MTLARFARKFGVGKGFPLFYKFKTKQLNSIRIPQVRSSFMLRKDTSDIEAFYQIFFHDEYDTKYVAAPVNIIDGGANVGLFTIWVKNKFPDAQVIAIEPDPENYAVMQKNVSMYKNVHCENCGLWDRSTRLKVYDKYNRGNWGFVAEENQAGTIQALSIDDIMQKYNWSFIDILKLDIETAEKKVFSGDYKGWLKKTRMLVVELHDEMEPGCSKTFFDAVHSTFDNYTYAVKGENTIIINNDMQ